MRQLLIVVDRPVADGDEGFALVGDEPTRVTFLRVLPPTRFRVTRLGPLVPLAEELDGYDDAELRQARRVAWRNGVGADVLLMSGDTAACVAACARRLRPDAIVLQTSRRRGVSSLVRGVPRSIRRAAPCPVLLAA